MNKHPDLFRQQGENKVIRSDKKKALDINVYCRKYLPEINMMHATQTQMDSAVRCRPTSMHNASLCDCPADHAIVMGRSSCDVIEGCHVQQ